MLRSIKSAQRKIRIIALKVDGTTLSGPDAKHIKHRDEQSPVAGELIMQVPFADDSQVVFIGTAGNHSVTGKELTIDVSGGVVELMIVGSDTPEQY